MATNANTHAPLGAVSILHAVDAVYHSFQNIARWNDARKTRKELSSLTDAQLADIGLSRAEIADF